ncbi:sporulation histidine kinase inhibitor Sda [Bacillus sp. JJ1503]|uniref:sporulation histidine kinase inhibitor Sda n=1 Tax=unclassified Bacillus (in: firmicutes) TaxID=185979 RepID=UPI002FFE8DD5
MKSLACLTDTVLINTYLKAIDQNLDPSFIEILSAELENRGLEVKSDKENTDSKVIS